MNKHIVFERTGDSRTPKADEQYENHSGDVVYAETDFSLEEHPILRRLPDAEVEALEAQLAEAADHVHDLKLMEADRDAWKARAEKAEAERDELRAKVKEDANDLLCTREALREARNERDRAQSEAFAQAEIAKSFIEGRAVEIGGDTRARFERETAADLMRRIVNVDVRKDGSYGFEYARASKCVADARDLADEVFGPAPAAVKADAPLPPAANPFMVYGPGACNPAPVPAPPQFKIGDPVAPLTAEELEICRLPSRLAGIGATFYEENEGRAFIGFDGDSAWWIDKHYIRQAPPAPPQFKVGDPVVNSKGRRGKVAALYPNEMLDLCVRWDGDPHSCYEMSRELRPAPPEPWTPKKGDQVRCTAIGIVGDAIDEEQSAVHFEDFILDLKPSDLALVRRAEDAQ